ncbi:MAG: nucleoside deaminase [Rubrivivax sp.]|nr:nucleoside deaminase [Rubrivivax sp.]
MTEAALMQQAIVVAGRGIAAGQTPFGAVIARRGVIIAATHNTVWATGDPTAHAEVNAIRAAAAALGTIDLSGCQLFTTCEPCPMCLAATHWARLDVCWYGATIADAAAAGFNELHLPAERLAREGGSPLQVRPGPLRAECAALFGEWRERGAGPAY